MSQVQHQVGQNTVNLSLLQVRGWGKATFHLALVPPESLARPPQLVIQRGGRSGRDGRSRHQRPRDTRSRDTRSRDTNS